jgi:hypothetical protein
MRSEPLDEALRASQKILVLSQQNARDGGIEDASVLFHIWQALLTHPAAEGYRAAMSKPTRLRIESRTPGDPGSPASIEPIRTGQRRLIAFNRWRA